MMIQTMAISTQSLLCLVLSLVLCAVNMLNSLINLHNRGRDDNVQW